MKVRKLAVALALAGGLGSGVAQALGLGEIELQSYLNEPLDAEIRLPQSRGVDPSDVYVNIAPESAYETVGLDRDQFLSKLRFQVVTESDGSLVVQVSSREPLREPYLNFLLELTWPSGRLMREYAVLVDPPVYAEDSGVQESVTAPSAATSTSQPSQTRDPESVRRQAQAEASVQRGYQGNTLGPTDSSDTLWTIASRVRPDNSVTTQQVMIAIQDLNPDAFIGANINRLKRGEVLRVPTLEQIQSRSRAEATRIVAQQNREFQSPQRTVDATDTQVAQASGTQAQASGDELKLLVADADSRETSEGGSAGGDGQLPGGVDAGAAVAMEELESARRENEELSGRVQDLEGQIETLQRLLELKNSQLADIQGMAQEGEEPSPVQTSGEEGVAESGEGEADAEADVNGEAAADAGVDAEVDAEAEAAVEGSAIAGGTAVESEEASEPVTGELAEQEGSEVDLAAEQTDEAAEADPVMTEAGSETEVEQPEVVEGSDASEVAENAGVQATEQPQPEEAAPEFHPATANVEPAQPDAQPAAEQGVIAGIIDTIRSNLLYQVALGGGLILLLLLLLVVARRNANREKAFYEQLNQESESEGDDLELTLDDDESFESDKDSAIAEADNYIAFGRHEQAAQTLEEAISREPSRTDLRLKLLGIYAETQNQVSFDKQYSEIESLDDEQALATANELRAKLEDAESIPSIDDLESQLRSDSFSTAEPQVEHDFSFASDNESDATLSDELLADQYDAQKEEKVEDEFAEFDTDFADFELNEPEESKSDVEEASTLETEGENQSRADDAIEFDLSDVSLESKEPSEPVKEKDDLDSLSLEIDEDAGSLDFDLEESLSDTTEKPESGLAESDESGAELETFEDSLDFDLEEAQEEVVEGDNRTSEEKGVDNLDSLDESFLDELDAELDKVAGEDEAGESVSEDGGLDELELDVSDEDLALMEEFSETTDAANDDEPGAPALGEDLSLEDTLEPEGASKTGSPEEEVAAVEEFGDLGSLDTLEEPAESEIPVTSEVLEGESASKPSAPVDIDEGDLGEDDDFDFLAGTDEAATKLDLARAYIEMGDADGARDILEEVSLEGDEEQKAEAQDLLKNLA
ncbi:FimV/HubP family polar landmark protein [Marinobacter sp. chi1]|uniref:FimV/HubP family polar landmark protein n=1 Tax=Marinobacter suaedae TaxID=3057675 RepID=A0ABT8W2E4_9GAMM|nr:FimV/HubP family polar landmark protein [Marinobacter sp. chi1]MDO3722333.1 FimV/HubP family polar landmark protein [Marinobacter sp. chi1]